MCAIYNQSHFKHETGVANTLHLSVAYDKIGIRVSFFLGDAPTPVHTYIDLTNISSPGTMSHIKAPSSVKSN